MRYLRFTFAALLILGLLNIGNTAQTPAFEKDKLLLQVMQKVLDQYHYLDLEMNDEFSENVFDTYLNQLDYGKKYFLTEDISSLDQYKAALDEEIKSGSLSYFRETMQLFKNRLVNSKNIYEKILSEPFDFTKQETIELDPEKLDYVSSKKALRERWRKLLKYKTLVRLSNKISNQEKQEKTNPNFPSVRHDSLEADARQSVLKSQQNLYDRIMELDHQDHLTRYLNAIGGVYDPHTNYYPPKDKENFDISMSGSFQGIGATLQKKDGYIKVIRIITGSASWRQGELEVGDRIMKVAQEDEEPVNVMDMPLDEAVQLIRGPKGTEVRLTVKKRDGSIQEIPIVRDIVELRETYAKSAIINKDDTKAGYIKLPKFYVDMNNKNGRSCYKDVKKHIKHLKEKDAEGLILDLRNNGGGSLGEVIKIAGLFIDQGPVVQVKDPFDRTEVYKDENKGVAFEKPLIIMVNSFSASASEILAGAIKDYNRGIIAGSSSTYGKGTVQRFVNFDKAIPEQLQMFKPLGSVKITIQKFYRINGYATQLKGISPHIVIPDKYSYMDIGEKERKNAMQWDKIDPAAYEKWQGNYNNSKLKRLSNKRIKKNEYFNLVEAEAKNIREKSQVSNYSLNLEKFMAYQQKLKQEAQEINKKKDLEATLDVHLFTTKSEEKIANDSTEIARKEKWQKNISKDLYVDEAVNILGDMN